jgi:hypothetical protein
MSDSDPIVVDTNVLRVASKKAEQASANCVLNCINVIIQIKEQKFKLVLDDLGEILDEYGKRLKEEPFSAWGKNFYIWLKKNQYTYCEFVPIKPIENENNYEEFPQDPDLVGFDNDDRKFVAVALKYAEVYATEPPPIFNAVDSDWADYDVVWKKYNIEIRYLCPEHKTK